MIAPSTAVRLGLEVCGALGSTYHALGTHYTTTGRTTKALRHCQQGISLFHSVRARGDWGTRPNLRGRLCDWV